MITPNNYWGLMSSVFSKILLSLSAKRNPLSKRFRRIRHAKEPKTPIVKSKLYEEAILLEEKNRTVTC